MGGILERKGTIHEVYEKSKKQEKRTGIFACPFRLKIELRFYERARARLAAWANSRALGIASTARAICGSFSLIT